MKATKLGPYEYSVESEKTSHDSETSYKVDLHPDNFGCSCGNDYYRLRPRRRREPVTSELVCKHCHAAIIQFYIDNFLNK